MRVLLTLLILFTSFHSFSQEHDLYNKIYSYEDSTKILIKNSRRLILESIKVGDYAQADRIKDYAENNVDQNQYTIFTIGEDLLISYHTYDFSKILAAIQNWDNFKSEPFYIYPVENDKLYENLLNYSLRDTLRINKSIEQIVVSEQQQDVLKIVFKSMLTYNPEASISQNELNVDVAKYLNDYEVSPYHKFLKENIRLIYEYKWGGAVSFGSGFGGLNDGLSQYIESFTPVFLGMEFYFGRRIFLGARIQGGAGETVQNFNFNYDGIWSEGMRVNPLYIGLTSGYAFLDTKRFRVAGLVELGLFSITPVDDEKNRDTRDLKLNSFTYGPSLFIDYFPFNVENFNGTIRFGIRVQTGVLLLNFDNRDERFNGNNPYLGISLVLDQFYKSVVLD